MATTSADGPAVVRTSADAAETAVDSPVDGRAARWQGHKASRRAVLANEARKAVHRLGAEVSMEDLASALGTSKSILYRYFSDKTGLQHAVGEVVVTRMLDALVEASHASVTPRENLHSVIGVYLEMVEGSPAVYGFVTQVPAVSSVEGGSPLRSFLDAVSSRVLAPIAESLLVEAAGPDHGRHSIGPRGIESIAQTWAAGAVGFVRGAGDRWLATQPTERTHDRHALTDEVTAWLWTGVVGFAGTVDVTYSTPPVVIDVEVVHGHQQEKP
jgi:AcrR family transcriptional regulator